MRIEGFNTYARMEILLVGIFLLFVNPCISQNQLTADSLKVIFSVENNDSIKIELLKKLSFHEIGDLLLGLEYAEELIRLSKAANKLGAQSTGWLQKGNKHWNLGQSDSALSSFLKAAEIAKQADYLSGQGTAYNGVASLYTSIGNHENAISYFRRSITIFRQTKDSTQLATAIFNLGDTYLTVNQYDSALLYLDESGKIFDQLDYKPGQAYTFGNTGMVYANLGDYRLAEQNISKAIVILDEIEDFYPICVYLLTMSDIFRDRSDASEALSYAQKSLSLSTKYQLKQQISDAHQKLSELYEQTGELDKSLSHYKDFIAYRDSVINLKTVQEMADMRTDHEVSLRENNIEKLKQEKELQQTYIFVVIALFLLSIAVVLYFRQRFRTTRILAEAERVAYGTKVNNLLKHQETQALQAMVQGKEEERRHLAKELHNHLGSLLATVKVNLNGLKSADQSKYQTILKLVDQATQDVRNISHELNMGVSEDFGLQPALKELVNHLRKANQLKVQLSVSLEAVIMDVQSEILIYRIVQELVSNVLKHAEASHLSIMLTGIEEGNLVNIIVEDDGKGLSPQKEKKSNDGIGLSSLEQMVTQLDGALHIDSPPAGGTIINIDLPVTEPPNEILS